LAASNGRDPGDINIVVMETRVVFTENSLGGAPALLRQQLWRLRLPPLPQATHSLRAR